MDNFAKFTNIVDRPEVVLAKVNAFNLSDVSASQNCLVLTFFCKNAKVKLFKNGLVLILVA